MSISRDWCEEQNMFDLDKTDGLCPECERRSAERAEERREYPIAPHPADVERIEPGSVLDVTQADLDYAGGCLGWGGGVFSVQELAQRLSDYAAIKVAACNAYYQRDHMNLVKVMYDERAAKIAAAVTAERMRCSALVLKSAAFADEQGDQEYGDALRRLAVIMRDNT